LIDCAFNKKSVFSNFVIKTNLEKFSLKFVTFDNVEFFIVKYLPALQKLLGSNSVYLFWNFVLFLVNAQSIKKKKISKLVLLTKFENTDFLLN
jgi:hypothetical protein